MKNKDLGESNWKELISKLKENFNIELKEVFVATEDVRFSLPSTLSA